MEFEKLSKFQREFVEKSIKVFNNMKNVLSKLGGILRLSFVYYSQGLDEMKVQK